MTKTGVHGKFSIYVVKFTTKVSEPVRKWTIVFRSQMHDADIDELNAGNIKMRAPMKRQKQEYNW